MWDLEGIVVVGSGHVVCYNTISGFGDALSMHHDTSVPNRANDFYGNDVLWTGDNGIELDFGERNVPAFRNVNDGFAGASPDVGALERGATAPHYGVR